MIKFKVNGKERQIGTSWDEVSFGQFLDMIGKKTKTEVLALLLQEPEEIVRRAEIQNLDALWPYLKFTGEVPQIEETPKKLGAFRFPKDIKTESVMRLEAWGKYHNEGEKRIQDKEIERGGREHTEYMALYCAVYCAEDKLFDSEDDQAIRGLAKSYHALPCTEVLAAGSFFRDKLLSLETGLPMSSLHTNILMKNSRRGLINSVKRLVSMGRWT